MFGGRSYVMMSLACALLATGCAGRNKEMTRLQSQLGLLDERITQLERSSISTGLTGSAGEVASTDVGATLGASVQPNRTTSFTGQGAVRSLKKYSTREVQTALKNAGFYQGSVDGKMGPITRDAIREFQRANGLRDDGVVGKKTWAKLSAYTELSSTGGASESGQDASTFIK